MAAKNPRLSPDARKLLDSGNVGRTEPVVGVPANPVTLLDIVSDDCFSEMVTVYLTDPILENRDLGTIDAVAGARPTGVAIVEWGNGGVQHSAEVDFARGCAFSLACSFLRVKARIDPLSAAASTTAAIRLGAHAGFGTRPGPLRGPSRTIPFTPTPILAGVFSSPAIIPPFARSGTLLMEPVAIPAVQSRVRLQTYNTITIAEFVGPVVDLWHIPVPVNAYVVSVFNGEAVPVSARMQWDLAL